MNAGDPTENQIRKLRKINEALMARVERSTDISGSAFALFQTAISLEGEVRARTQDLQGAMDELSESNASLEQAHAEAERARRNLADAFEAVQEGFALFGPDDRLVMCNERYRSLLPDISDQVGPGLLFDDYARYASLSKELFLADGQTSEDWAARRLSVHGRRHATFTVALRGDRWIQVSERRTANGATAVIQKILPTWFVNNGASARRSWMNMRALPAQRWII
jgi:PAS domain-containing protein